MGQLLLICWFAGETERPFLVFLFTKKQILPISVVELPTKIVSYCIIAALLNAKRPLFGQSLVYKVQEELSIALEDGQRRRAKMLLRFLATLVNMNVVDVNDLSSLLSSFIRAIQDAGDAVPQEYSDNLAYILLSTIPYCAKHLDSSAPGDLDRILSDIDSYMETRRCSALPSSSVFNRDKNIGEEDVLVHLVAALKQCRRNTWSVPSIQEFDSELATEWSSAVVQELVPVEIPEFVS